MKTLPLSRLAWRFRDCASRSASWLPAVVPGCVHSDLLRAKKIPDPFFADNENSLQWISEREWEYRVVFDVTQDFLDEECVELDADGLDSLASVRLNGAVVARTDNMFVAHRFEVRRLLRPRSNVLAIRFASASRFIRENRTEHSPRETNDPVGGCTRIRKQQCQFGWDWGPRFVTAGIWRDIRLEAWSGNRLANVRVRQEHAEDFSRCTLHLAPECVRVAGEVRCAWRLSLGECMVARGHGNRVVIDSPQLWWPNGQGAQPLYSLVIEVSDARGMLIGSWSRRLGLRTVVLDRSADKWGEAFRFAVNGRAIFAKGANWIPAHSFVAGLTREDYARDLRAAAAAHMNMIRVWGGGVYESEAFYDLCDELGLLVWQDFMFACTLYPGDAAFVESVRMEAAQQISRLRHRACLALWCGNNEVWSSNAGDLARPEFASYRSAYERVFHEALPGLVREFDGVTGYWPSSPWHGDGFSDQATGELRGDTHYWDVWHARHPVRDYEKAAFRFVSEFGMQSYSSPETNASFCPPRGGNIFGPVMECHQKNRAGNQIILDYVSRRYRFPRSQVDLIYLSQLNQAYCMQVGVEYYRRNMPRCMGALYWQLNDCWPVASWSSIEFTGRWKALHFAARRFFAPLLVSAHVPGDEFASIGNYRNSSVREVFLYTVSDNPQVSRCVLRWDVFHIDGRVLSRGQKNVVLRYGESVRQKSLNLADVMAAHGRDSIYVRIALDDAVSGTRVSEESVFLAPPRFMALRNTEGKTRVRMRRVSDTSAEFTFTSRVFQHRFAFDFANADAAFSANDNFFDLYPNEPKVVGITFAKPLSKAEFALLKARVAHRSLADTY